MDSSNSLIPASIGKPEHNKIYGVLHTRSRLLPHRRVQVIAGSWKVKSADWNEVSRFHFKSTIYFAFHTILIQKLNTVDIQCMYTFNCINYSNQKTFTLRMGFKSSKNTKDKNNKEIKKREREHSSQTVRTTWSI